MQTWRPGDYAVVHDPTPGGALVRALQDLTGVRSRWEHVIVGLGDGMIVEAMPCGAVKVPMHYTDVYWSGGRLPANLTPDDGQRTRICSAAESLVGTPYGYLDYAAIAAHYWHLPVPGLRRYIASTRTLICSQMAAAAYLAAGITLFPAEWDGYVRPVDMARLVGAPEPREP